MPAFSYKERFVPFIKNFTKTGTIRAFRKYLVKPGQMSYHYFGMRTKFCTKLIDPQEIKTVQTIFIYKDGAVYMSDETLTKQEAKELMNNRRKLSRRAKKLSKNQKDVLAWNDGFRDDEGSLVWFGMFDTMIRFWRQTHSLPFCGQYIKWR